MIERKCKDLFFVYVKSKCKLCDGKFFSNNLGTTEASITQTHSLKINTRKINSANSTNYFISTCLSHVHNTLTSRAAFTFK